MKTYENITKTIGSTPLVRLHRIEETFELKSRLYAKLEYFNPGNSVKDRIANAMIYEAESKGLLKKGYTIIEPTSGNTGIGLAMVAAAKGYEVILVMPDTLTVERRKIMLAYGAKLVLTEGSKGMKGAIEKAEELLRNTKEGFMPNQFKNLANPRVHYHTTGPEIWADLDGVVDAFVAGVGTGGTISGVGKYLKEKNPRVRIIAVEPKDSPVLSKGEAGFHKIQGIGAGFIPDTLDTSVYDEIAQVTNEEAFAHTKSIPKLEGIFVGISSGAALKVAIDVASREEFRNKKVVVLFPDTGERYLSTSVFDE